MLERSTLVTTPVFKHTLLFRDADTTKLPKLECVHTLKGLALPRASHSGEIALAGSRRLRSTLAAAPVLFVHAATLQKLILSIFCTHTVVLEPLKVQ